MGAFQFFFFVYFRIFLPLVLLGVIVTKISLISFLYMVCLLITPLLPTPSKKTMKGVTGIFLKCFIIISLLPVLGHIFFHLIFWPMLESGDSYGNVTICAYTEKLLRHIGYQSLRGVSLYNILRLSVPDVLTFLLSILTITLSIKNSSLKNNTTVFTPETSLFGGEMNLHHRIQVLFEYLQNMMLLAAGIIAPSVLGGVYFVIVIVSLTMWGCFKSAGSRYLLLQVLLLLFTGSHILLLHLYQFQFFQETLPPAHRLSRILGLYGIVQTKCNEISKLLLYPNIKWSVALNPFVLLILYWVVAANINIWIHWFKDVHHFSESVIQEAEGSYNDGNQDKETDALSLEFLEMGSSSDAKSEYKNESQSESTNTLHRAMKRMPWMSIAFMIMKHSHVLTLMAIMAWSITYHSILTFMFLLTACILWLMPNTHRACLMISPLLVLYAEFLLFSQYVFCMDFDTEVLTSKDKRTLYEIGFKKFTDDAFPNLALQTVYSCFIFLTFRQRCYEIQIVIPRKVLVKSKKSLINRLLPLGMEYTTYDSMTMISIGNYLWHLFCKYWIFFCTIMMAVVSLQDIVIYRIIYMVLFLFFVITFTLNYEMWRSINYIFWWVVTVYSILVLTLIYTYQFENAHNYWVNITGFDDEMLEDIGLQKYDTTGLFINLLTPTCFVVIVIMQLRYFHKTFLNLSCLDRYIVSDKNMNMHRKRMSSIFTRDRLKSTDLHNLKVPGMRVWVRRKSLRFSEVWSQFITYVWRLGQIHIFKVVTFTVMAVAVIEVSALTAVYVFLITLLLPIPHTGKVLSLLLLVWTAVIILIKMIFELHITDDDFWSATCYTGNSSIEVNLLDNAAWFGFKKYDPKTMTVKRYLWMYMLVVTLIVFESIIHYHQLQYYAKPEVRKPHKGILFPHITRLDADKSVVSCIKYFANYFFYKFGLECCYIMTAIVVSFRVDFVALIYIFIVAVLLMLSRQTVANLWIIYKLFLAMVLSMEFLLVLGFPYSTCIRYPWTGEISIPNNLRHWLYLPEYLDPPESNKLIVDFLQLLFVSLQAVVFKIESKYETMEEFGGGDNSDILADVELNLPIPYSDFTLQQKSAIETLKFNVFENMYWVTMAIIFITGATRINIFSFFYVMAVFTFMWFGKQFYLKPLRQLLRMWNYLIFYCVLVLFLKTLLQLVGCVYIHELIDSHQCWVAQLFGVQCLLAGHVIVPSSECVVEHDNAGLAWDVVCLTFLLMQRRIYSSHYFRHTADTIHAQNNLVAKGAEIINRILIREVQRRNEEERQLLMKIKQQMRDLKTKNTKLRKDYHEPEEHFQAIRAGDYYLVDYDQSEPQKPTGPPPPEAKVETMQPEIPTPKNFSSPVDLSDNLEYLCMDFTSSESTESVEEENPVFQYAKGFGLLTQLYYQIVTMAYDPMGKMLTDDAELEPSTVSNIRSVLNVLFTLWFRFIDWLIHWCNTLSYDYRLVAKKLSEELLLEKEKILIFKRNRRSGDPYILNELMMNLETLKIHESLLKSKSETHTVLSLDELEKEDAEEMKQQFVDNTQRFNRLMVSCGLVLASHSQLLCYFLMILDHMTYSSLLSLPLPLMVFLWGMLSVPRPSKTFWVTVISYTESVVVCKYFYQFAFFPWNEVPNSNSPFFPPRIIGIEKVENYASVDIALLLALFLHRSILQKYGLWRDSADITADMMAAGIKENPHSEVVSSSESSFSDENERYENFENIKGGSRFMHGMYFVLNPFANFFREVTRSRYSATTDMYTPMFFCDLVLFLVLVFGFNYFGPVDTTVEENVTTYLRDSKIPIPFVIMLITQFISILIDRAIFLRKFVLGKYIFQILLVIIIHAWMFFVLPAITRRSFNDNKAAQIWYFIKCIYFALSAHQIRCGYPVRTIGNILTKNYSFANLILYKGFLAIPFLLELRALMDWTWSESTLSIGNWLQMEDIYANIFVIKCWREFEKKFPQERAVKKNPAVKYLAGGALLFSIISIVWFPLLFFSFLHTVYVSNPPVEASFTISIGGYQPLVQATATGDNIRPLTDAEFSSLKSHYARDRNTYSLISNFEPEDVTLIEFDGKSLSIWGVSPIGKEALVQDLRQKHGGKLFLSVKLKFLREASKSQTGETKKKFEISINNPTAQNKFLAEYLAGIIEGTYNDSVDIHGAFPRYLRLTSKPQAIVMDKMVEGRFGIGYSNISLQLHVLTEEETSESWGLCETLQGPSALTYDPNRVPLTVPTAYVITFNDRKTPPSLEFIAGLSIFTGGVIVMYVSFVLVVFKFIRVSFVSGRILYIHLEEAPDVDYLLQTIDDMYLAREMKDFWLEEEIFAKLIFILRCPDVLFNVTRLRTIVTINPQAVKKRSVNYTEDRRKSEVKRQPEPQFMTNTLSRYMTLGTK